MYFLQESVFTLEYLGRFFISILCVYLRGMTVSPLLKLQTSVRIIQVFSVDL